MIIIGIYKITSPSGKIYIGQSCNIERRKAQYKRVESCVKKQIKIYRSILKYGWDNHIFEIMEECSLNLLNIRERYWQEQFDVLNPKVGLNCKLTNTLEKKQLHSVETIEKISNWHKEFHILNENRMKGKTHKDSTKQLMSKRAKERYKKELNPNSKSCYCTITNKLWNTKTECWKELFLNEFTKGHFINMLNGQSKNKTTIKNYENK